MCEIPNWIGPLVVGIAIGFAITLVIATLTSQEDELGQDICERYYQDFDRMEGHDLYCKEKGIHHGEIEVHLNAPKGRND